MPIESPDDRRLMPRASCFGRVAGKPPVRTIDETAAEGECARALGQGLRQQLREAAVAYLAGVAEAIPTLDEATVQAALGWIDATRAALDGAGPAEGAAEALRARSAGSGRPEAWLGALVPALHSMPPSPSRRRVRRAAESGHPDERQDGKFMARKGLP